MTQHVSGSFSVLNPEPPIYVDVIKKYSEDPDGSAEENFNLGRMLVKTIPICHDLGSHLEDPDKLSSSMTNFLDSESNPAYHPSASPTSSSSLSGSNHSSCKLVDMAPKRTCRRVTNVARTQSGQDNADHAGPSGVHLDLQEMRTEWDSIQDIKNLIWVPAT
jgi:hypothetical protein